MCSYEIVYQPAHETACATPWACVTHVRVEIETTEPITDEIRRGIETRLFMIPGHWRKVSQSEIPEIPPAPKPVIIHSEAET